MKIGVVYIKWLCLDSVRSTQSRDSTPVLSIRHYLCQFQDWSSFFMNLLKYKKSIKSVHSIDSITLFSICIHRSCQLVYSLKCLAGIAFRPIKCLWLERYCFRFLILPTNLAIIVCIHCWKHNQMEFIVQTVMYIT